MDTSKAFGKQILPTISARIKSTQTESNSLRKDNDVHEIPATIIVADTGSTTPDGGSIVTSSGPSALCQTAADDAHKFLTRQFGETANIYASSPRKRRQASEQLVADNIAKQSRVRVRTRSNRLFSHSLKSLGKKDKGSSSFRHVKGSDDEEAGDPKLLEPSVDFQPSLTASQQDDAIHNDTDATSVVSDAASRQIIDELESGLASGTNAPATSHKAPNNLGDAVEDAPRGVRVIHDERESSTSSSLQNHIDDTPADSLRGMGANTINEEHQPTTSSLPQNYMEYTSAGNFRGLRVLHQQYEAVKIDAQNHKLRRYIARTLTKDISKDIDLLTYQIRELYTQFVHLHEAGVMEYEVDCLVDNAKELVTWRVEVELERVIESLM